MPKKKINVKHRIEHLSILDENGKVDTDLEPEISEEKLIKLHRFMRLSRRFDERMLSLQREGRMGTFAPIKGQEASQLGAAAALDPKDWLVPSFRETAAELWHGKDMVNILLVYAGYNEGGKISEGVNAMPVAIPVATQIPHAVGLAYAMKYRGDDRVAMVFFGDGATSEGDFHEAMNYAGVWEIPVVFVCQNNQWAISTPRSRQTAAKTLAQKALAYGVAGIQVDGNDVLAVYSAAKEAVDRARSGEGPSMIECLTYRMSVHTTADDPKRYRSEKEVKKWEKRDPIERFQKYLMEKDLLSENDIEELEDEIEDEIAQTIENWEKQAEALGDPLMMFDHLFEETPPYVAAQREAFQKTLNKNRETENG